MKLETFPAIDVVNNYFYFKFPHPFDVSGFFRQRLNYRDVFPGCEITVETLDGTKLGLVVAMYIEKIELTSHMMVVIMWSER